MFPAEFYLSLIQGWQDPCPAPILELHNRVTVVRDDLLAGGSKSRVIDPLIRYNPKVKEWVYGGSPQWGYGQLSLAYVTAKYGKQSTVFIAQAKELHRNSRRAKEYGAQIIQVPVGFLKVCEARAREYVAEDPENRRLVPFGLADATVYGAIIEVARSLPFTPDEVWCAASSGVLNRGLQLAWPNAQVSIVSVGHKLTPEGIGRATMYRHYLKFEQPCRPEHLPPFPSVPEYDAKVFEFLLKYADRSKTVLLWNVGA